MKKKILFLIPTLAHGGAERVLVNLVNNLDSSKYDLTVQTLFDIGVNRQHLHKNITYLPGWKWQFRGNSHFCKLFSPKFLYRLVVKDSYDIVISYLEGITARVLAGCPDDHVKKAAWVHIELNTPQMAAIGFRSVKEAQRLYTTYDKIIAVSREVRSCFLNNLSITSPDTQVLYNTNETDIILDQALLPPDDPRFSQKGIILCSVAKLMHTKGFDRLLNVHKKLIKEGFPHTVYILGIGEEENALRRKIREYGVETSFQLLGFKDNPYQYVSRCDLYVCSSRREGFSTAVTEALIVGTPVVSTDCSGAKELLGENNEYGLVVENSEDGIYQGLKQMLSEPETLAHYRDMAAQRGKVFSREKTVQAVETMLDSL